MTNIDDHTSKFCKDCENFGTVNCGETYREPTNDDDICECFISKADCNNYCQ